ncbi:MAG: diaminopimelate decarboxylase [Candidatus Nanohaloarchaea archaeon]
MRVDGEKYIGGVPVSELVEEYDTPLYVYDRDVIQERFTELEEAFDSRYPDFSVHYAVKANSNPEIVRTMLDIGAHLDCASIPELRLAEELEATDRVLYTGLFNREDELEAAREHHVTINLNSAYLLEKMDEVPEKLSFRVNPGQGRGEFGLVLAGDNSQFGVPEDRVVEAYRKAKDRGVEEFGIHMMTGSNIRDAEYFEQITEKLLDIAAEVSRELGIEFSFIDIGGGLGIPYRPEQERLDVERVAEGVTSVLKEYVEETGIGEPELRIEPGRYLVAEAGYLLTRVTGVKESGKTFVGVDTGMNHLIRPALHDAYHPVSLVSDEREHGGEKTVVGPVCSSEDVLAEDRELPRLEQGDILAIEKTGAYGFSMASNWNTRRLPAEVIVDSGNHRLIRERQEVEDLFHGTDLEGET